MPASSPPLLQPLQGEEQLIAQCSHLQESAHRIWHSARPLACTMLYKQFLPCIHHLLVAVHQWVAHVEGHLVPCWGMWQRKSPQSSANYSISAGFSFILVCCEHEHEKKRRIVESVETLVIVTQRVCNLLDTTHWETSTADQQQRNGQYWTKVKEVTKGKRNRYLPKDSPRLIILDQAITNIFSISHYIVCTEML